MPAMFFKTQTIIELFTAADTVLFPAYPCLPLMKLKQGKTKLISGFILILYPYRC